MNPGDIYSRKWRGEYLYRVVINSFYNLPNDVQVARCTSAGNRIDNKIQWMPKATIKKHWSKIA